MSWYTPDHTQPWPSRLETMQSQLAEAIGKARALADRAIGQDRDFTTAERAEAEAAVKKIKHLRQAITEQHGDNALRKSIADLGNEIGYQPAGSGYTGSPGGSYTPPSDWRKSSGGWGAKVADYHAKAGAKSLLTTGSVPVSVPLAPEPVKPGERAQFLRQLLAVERVGAGERFRYLRQTVRTNNAATVPEGARKPTSIYTLDDVEDRCRTIAHLSEPIPRQQLDDAALLRQFVDAEMRYGLELELDDQILNGDGTVSATVDNLTGILNTSGIQAQPWSSNVLTTTRKAITALESADLTGDGWVFNPTDWEAVELAAAEQYAANPNQPTPVDRQARRLWGLPVVVTTAMAAGTAVLGDWRGAAKLYIREEARLDWSENIYRPDALGAGVGASDFERNLVTWRAEGRFGLAVLRPSNFIEVDVTAL
jgi:HK97 family phage major capsid protein